MKVSNFVQLLQAPDPVELVQPEWSTQALQEVLESCGCPLNRWSDAATDALADGLATLLDEAAAREFAKQLEFPERYAHERSVMRVYLEEGAMGNHDIDEVVGLLTMTLMAAVFNTQVSLAWILAHLYSDDELLARARAEARSGSRHEASPSQDYLSEARLDSATKADARRPPRCPSRSA